MIHQPARGWMASMAAGLIIVSGGTAESGVVTYTSSAAFGADLAGFSIAIEDYASFTPGDLINADESFNGLTYSNFKAGPFGTLQGGIITDQFSDISGRSLGGNQENGDRFFYGGDSFTVTFATPIYALGIFFNVNRDSGNYGFTTSVGAAITESTSYDLSTFVFAGLISSSPFTSSTILSMDQSLGSYTIPELVTGIAATAIPEPSSLTMCLLSIAVVSGAFMRVRGPTR